LLARAKGGRHIKTTGFIIVSFFALILMFRLTPQTEASSAPSEASSAVSSACTSSAVQEYESMSIPDVDTAFKSFMDWRSITLRSSEQYRLQKRAYTDVKGFRRYRGKYMIALGSYYAQYIGQEFRITLSSGIVIDAMVGDIKADKDTDKTHRYCKDGVYNVVEFIIDREVMPLWVRELGDVSVMGLQGEVVKIEREVTP
jgi:hypothetical protein